MIGNIGWPGLLIILLAVVLLFGRGKISQVMGDVAKGINAFRRGMRDGAEEEEQAKAIKGGETIDVSADKTRSSN
ncbi:MAG: twin-arginine translocase TatA/TatE family subunit [Pseudomonadota bacterium]